MRGRKPKPTALKILEGNPGKRRLNHLEPKPADGVPPCPRWLSKRARAEWRRVTPELTRLKLLTRVDMAALAGYCQSWADYSEAVEWMEANGRVMTLRDDKGNVKWIQPVPQFSIALKSLDRVRAFASEFGLTPGSRVRLQVITEEKSNAESVLDGDWELGMLLNGPRRSRTENEAGTDERNGSEKPN